MYNIKVKYSIINNNIYNFDKTGFVIGIIIAIIVIITLNGCSRAKQAQPSN